MPFWYKKVIVEQMKLGKRGQLFIFQLVKNCEAPQTHGLKGNSLLFSRFYFGTLHNSFRHWGSKSHLPEAICFRMLPPKGLKTTGLLHDDCQYG